MTGNGTQAALLALLTLGGCGHAAVRYETLDAPPGTSGAIGAAVAAAERGAVPIALPISRIVVQRHTEAPAGSAAAAGNGRANAPPPTPARGTRGRDSQTYRVSVVPRAGTQRYRVSPDDNFWQRNVLAVTHAEGSDVATNVGNTFTDQTVTRIGQIGSLVATIARIAAPVPAAAPAAAVVASARRSCDGAAAFGEFYIDIDDPALIGAAAKPIPSDDCHTWRVTRAEPPSAGATGTVTRAEFDALVRRNGGSARFWPVPACLTVQLTVARRGSGGPVTVLETSQQIADPERLQLYPIPEAGKIALHPVCGADLTNTPVDRWQIAFDALAAIDQQIQAIGKAAQ